MLHVGLGSQLEDKGVKSDLQADHTLKSDWESFLRLGDRAYDTEELKAVASLI